jgi:hypothetical protein
MMLPENNGITDEIWTGVKIGMLSHYKPIHELLSLILKDQKTAFEKQFTGMSSVEFSYDDYEKTRAALIETLNSRLTENDKKFILSFEQGNPEWDLLPIPNLIDLPAIKWKLLNIEKFKKDSPKKHRDMLEELTQTLIQ